MVPKGFLRHQVLRKLSEKPMAGSEIMNELEKQTSGSWRPSPGSIYPLLAWMLDEGYIEKASEDEVGIKRYTITEKGRTFLDEHIKMSEERNRRFRHFGPGAGFMGPMWFEFYPKKLESYKKSQGTYLWLCGNSAMFLTRDTRRKLRKKQRKCLLMPLEELRI